MKAGDVLRRLGDVELGRAEDLTTVLRAFRPGDRVVLTVLRDGTEIPLDFTFGERPR